MLTPLSTINCILFTSLSCILLWTVESQSCWLWKTKYYHLRVLVKKWNILVNTPKTKMIFPILSQPITQCANLNWFCPCTKYLTSFSYNSNYLNHGEHSPAILGDNHLIGETLEPVPQVGILQLNGGSPHLLPLAAGRQAGRRAEAGEQVLRNLRHPHFQPRTPISKLFLQIISTSTSLTGCVRLLGVLWWLLDSDCERSSQSRLSSQSGGEVPCAPAAGPGWRPPCACVWRYQAGYHTVQCFLVHPSACIVLWVNPGESGLGDPGDGQKIARDSPAEPEQRSDDAG